MSKMRAFIGLAVMLTAFMATAAPSSAWFKDLRVNPSEPGHCKTLITEPKACGTNLTPLQLKVGTSTFECPTEHGVILLWQIETEKEQLRTTVGPHLLIAFHCPEGKATIGGSESKAKLDPGCAIQLKQKALGGPIDSVRVDETCIIKVGAGLCTVTVAKEAANEELKEVKGENLTEAVKGLKYLLVNPTVKGITAKGSGLCGFTESHAGELTEGKTDIWDVSLV